VPAEAEVAAKWVNSAPQKRVVAREWELRVVERGFMIMNYEL
jgi:hypothetical protein